MTQPGPVLLRTGTPLTGRRIHGMVSDDYSLWTVQEALKALTRLGLIETQIIGRAGVHTINEVHASVAPLRALLDPVAALRAAVSAVTGSEVQAVILFGSIARGEATAGSDIDLAVVVPSGWDKRVELEDCVRAPRQRLRCPRLHRSRVRPARHLGRAGRQRHPP
jgi:predicted nucleotidyltransferase